MYSFISSEGKLVKTKTLKEFADTYNLKYGSAAQLACGFRWQLNGWCSTHPKAKKRRKRFTVTLVNTKTGERYMLGPSAKKFAKTHNLNNIMLGELINGTRQCYKGWMLSATYDTILEYSANTNF